MMVELFAAASTGAAGAAAAAACEVAARAINDRRRRRKATGSAEWFAVLTELQREHTAARGKSRKKRAATAIAAHALTRPSS